MPLPCRAAAPAAYERSKASCPHAQGKWTSGRVPARMPEMSGSQPAALRLPPTTSALLDDSTRPYFLWWTEATVGQLKEHLASADPEERAYWMGALLRAANTRDLWLFVHRDDISGLWPRLIRYL